MENMLRYSYRHTRGRLVDGRAAFNSAVATSKGAMSQGFGVGVGARDGARSACEGRRATYAQPARGPCSWPVRSP